jgi:hypothetical protein
MDHLMAAGFNTMEKLPFAHRISLPIEVCGKIASREASSGFAMQSIARTNGSRDA